MLRENQFGVPGEVSVGGGEEQLDSLSVQIDSEIFSLLLLSSRGAGVDQHGHGLGLSRWWPASPSVLAI